MNLVNHPAPEFAAMAYREGELHLMTLGELLQGGRWLVLFFYPKDFTFICPTELVAFGEQLPAFEALNAHVVGVSTDTAECHRGWATADERLANLGYPLIGDHKKELAAAYDVLDDVAGVALRGTFIVDPDARVRWLQVNDLDTGREIGEILRVLAALQTGGLTGCAWRPGQPTLATT